MYKKTCCECLTCHLILLIYSYNLTLEWNVFYSQLEWMSNLQLSLVFIPVFLLIALFSII